MSSVSHDTCSVDSSISTDSIDGSIYTKVSHEDHVMLAPDTYVGSVEPELVTRNILTTIGEGEKCIKAEEVKIVPAYYKIYDEVLTNAADHWSRLLSYQAEGREVKYFLTEIKVTLNRESGEITVYNNGEGIDIVYLDEHKMYPPELIFGSLLTGTNYDTEQEKTWGGKNGYGAKLANIFSRHFTVETVDHKRGLKFSQRFSNNMKERDDPVISKTKVKPYTKITFLPDYAKFSLTGMDEDHYRLFQARVYDMAAWTDKKVAIYLDEEKITTNNFETYVDLYLGKKDERPRNYLKINNRWEIVVTHSDDDTFQQVSLVNSINTCRGGKHIDYIVDQLKDGLIDMIKKKRKVDVKPSTIKNQLYVFVKATIVNPCFDSQTKETLTTSRKNFGSAGVIDPKFIERLYKTPLIEKIIVETEYKNNKSVKKTDGKKQRKIVGIPKLCDANKAGSKTAKSCTLILTEGDSAKTTAVAGLSIVGRDDWGVFPLKGKLLNVNDIDMSKVIKNEEISNIIKILGLKHGCDYSGLTDNNWPLRYGKILIMTDQDHDGSHIKGLVMNLFNAYWPSLIRGEFITTMVTPIVKATKQKQIKTFYNLSDYEKWKTLATTKPTTWKIKYYKGLGTSTTEEAKDYFKNLQLQHFTYDEETTNQALQLAFDKSKAAERKEWLKQHDPDNVLDAKAKTIDYGDFINKELIHFSRADCLRSIPDCRDGLKPSQRKIMYTVFKRKIREDIKVSQLAGSTSEIASYHHGEMSLHGTIVGLAQDFVGSNNVNLLVPSGQFGTRLQGGKDSASPRYIFTRISEITKLVFREEDMDILKYLDDDGFKIEPEAYLPIVPMILINGCSGIGTGWSSTIPCYNPIEVVDTIIERIKGKSTPCLRPWYRHFTGEITDETGGYATHGKYTVIGTYEIRITELPIGTWTQNYKEYLDSCVKDKVNEKTKQQFIKSYDDNCTESTVNFKVKLLEPYTSYTEKKLNTLLKLKTCSNTSTKNMVLYDSNGDIKRFHDTNEIIDDFFSARLVGYIDRRDYQLNRLVEDKNILEDKVKFIQGILDGEIDLRNKLDDVVNSELEAFGLRKLVGEPASFNYLTDMKMSSQTKSRVDELKQKFKNKEEELHLLENTSADQLWKNELRQLKEYLTKNNSSVQEKTSKAKAKRKATAKQRVILN